MLFFSSLSFVGWISMINCRFRSLILSFTTILIYQTIIKNLLIKKNEYLDERK